MLWKNARHEVGRVARRSADTARYYFRRAVAEAPRIMRDFDRDVLQPISSIARSAEQFARASPESVPPNIRPAIATAGKAAMTYEIAREAAMNIAGVHAPTVSASNAQFTVTPTTSTAIVPAKIRYVR